MKRTSILLILSVLFSASTVAAPANTDTTSQRFVPGDLFYPVENFVEDLEVALAGVVGGPDLKSKALANNADEALKEASILAEKNRSSKAAEMVDRYSQLMNKSRSLASESRERNLSEKLEDISEKNMKTLEDIRKKVPEEARKGIDKAINQSKKERGSENRPDKGKAPEVTNDSIPENKENKKNFSRPETDKSGEMGDLSKNLSEKSNTTGEASNRSGDLSNNENLQGNDSGGLLNEGEGSSSSSEGDNTSENPLSRSGSGLL